MGGETAVTGVHCLKCNSRSRTTVNDTILHTNSFVIRTGIEPVRTMSQGRFSSVNQYKHSFLVMV